VQPSSSQDSRLLPAIAMRPLLRLSAGTLVLHAVASRRPEGRLGGCSPPQRKHDTSPHQSLPRSMFTLPLPWSVKDLMGPYCPQPPRFQPAAFRLPEPAYCGEGILYQRRFGAVTGRAGSYHTKEPGASSGAATRNCLYRPRCWR
jgi:hypothetical protein